MNGDDLIELAFGQPLQEARDADGRFLGEHVASGYRDGDAEQVLRFQDPRDASGRPANVASLNQVVDSWPTVLHLLRAPTFGTQPELVSMLDAARTPAAIAIAEVVHAGENIARAPHPVAAPLSAAYKATIGYGQVLRTWILDGEPRVAPDVHAFLAVLDAQGWLIGAHHVCPGSRRAIAEAYCVLLGQNPSDFADAPTPIEGRSIDELVESAQPLGHALAQVEALLFAAHLHARLHPPASGSPLHEFTAGPGRLGVILQLTEYSAHAEPERAFGLVSSSDVVEDFVARVREPNADPAECFSRAASAALSPLGHDVTPNVLRRLRVAD